MISPAPSGPGSDAWVTHMRHGRFEAAWAIADAVQAARRGVDCTRWPRHEQFIWDGSPLHGRRVLIRCYHGLGDTVQFIRYAPFVRVLAREVIVWAQPSLIPLLRGMPGIDQLLPLHNGAPGVAYDVDVESMELAHLFRSTLTTLPATVPYLSVPTATPRRAGATFDIGLVWRGGNWDPRRDVPLTLLESLAELRGVRLHALQVGSSLAEWRGEPGTIIGGDPLATARAMQQLDLVITIDSFPAHLAGALGRPVWTLLQHDADWRWMTDRSDSPWYPTMRLFRQPAPGDWAAPIAAIRQELMQLQPGKPRSLPRPDAARARRDPHRWPVVRAPLKPTLSLNK
jgi:hypothetical protein